MVIFKECGAQNKRSKSTSPRRVSVKTYMKGSNGTDDDNNTFIIVPEAVLQHVILTEQLNCSSH